MNADAPETATPGTVGKDSGLVKGSGTATVKLIVSEAPTFPASSVE